MGRFLNGEYEEALRISRKAIVRPGQALPHPHVLECEILIKQGKMEDALQKKLFIDAFVANQERINEDTGNYIRFYTYSMFPKGYWSTADRGIDPVWPASIDLSKVERSVRRTFTMTLVT